MGYTFQASQYMNGYHFYIKSISMGYLFHPKSIWIGKIWKIVYEWGQFSKKVYEWGQFSIWEVYEWVMFFTWPGIWMGWGSGTPAAHPYPKSWQVTPPPVIKPGKIENGKSKISTFVLKAGMKVAVISNPESEFLCFKCFHYYTKVLVDKCQEDASRFSVIGDEYNAKISRVSLNMYFDLCYVDRKLLS